jgi:predicted DNA-binding protein
MEKKNTITIRLSDEQYGWLRALSRRSKRSQSKVVRHLLNEVQCVNESLVKTSTSYES